MLIPGPKSPGMDIDVYLRPLILELKELWEKGVTTWDAGTRKNFKLHALLLWTINDFPAYAMLSGWSMKGKFACPYCHKDTEYLWFKHRRKHCYMGHRRFLPPGPSMAQQQDQLQQQGRNQGGTSTTDWCTGT